MDLCQVQSNELRVGNAVQKPNKSIKPLSHEATVAIAQINYPCSAEIPLHNVAMQSQAASLMY